MPTKKRIYTWKLRIWLGMLVALSGRAQSVPAYTPLVLHSEPLGFASQTYYLADLIDERKERQAVALLLPLTKHPNPADKPVPVDLQGGAIPMIRAFIEGSWTPKARLHPLVIRLRACQVQESANPSGRVDGRVIVDMAVELKTPEENLHLVDYRGGARYSRPASQAVDVAAVLRGSLVDGLRFLDTWMSRQALTNEKLARSIQLHFLDQTENTEPDTVFYSPQRPLTWQDFRAQPRSTSIYAASVFPSFAYEGHSQVREGVIHLTLTWKVFMLPTSSWVRQGAKDDYGLNHEQRHFDLVKLVVERLKQRLRPDSLTLRHYDSEIQYQYIESFREMNHVQEAYDTQTRHGLDPSAQQQWNARIDEELRAFGIKP